MSALVAACSSEPSPTAPGPVTPPPPPPPPPPLDTTFTIPPISREFRGVWIATVANLDWPSSGALSATQQQGELVNLLDRAAALGANAVVFQIRVNGEKLYRGGQEPWATALAGRTDVDPGYDPLQFAIDSAHARGLELHAWFNPFRAGNASDTARLAPSHFARRRPDLRRVPRDRVTGGGVGLWFDPGEAEVQDYTIGVFTDVVSRYDLDAVHIDDFFYPYPNANGALVFPDDSTFARYTRGGGTLARADWRRDNINRFIERLYREVHALKPTLKVGISPFGIWRPGNPAGITGLDAFADIFADSRLWLQRGWVDYFSPQLYWSIASTGQSFPALLDWWHAQNTQQRHLWPGLAAYRVADGTSSAYAAQEILSQIGLTRDRATGTRSAGSILFRAGSVFDNRQNIFTSLATGTYAGVALPPASPWLSSTAPGTRPALTATPVTTPANAWSVRIVADRVDALRWWLVRWRSRSATTLAWSTRVIPATATTIVVAPSSAGARVDGVVVQAVDRAGNTGDAVVWRAP
ncbi:MAG: family 10 glycosylhydrolase [Gemmatimonadaceae bacterium]|nr:family 10 glycosylhydrolase [Gemmatimonadaceae bacterium]